MDLFEVWLSQNDSGTGNGVSKNAADRTRMPVQPDELIGRDRDVASARDLLLRPDCRLLTLLGPGGIGKTRIALAVAEAVAGSFDDGVYFIDLSQTQDPNTVPTLMLSELGLDLQGPSRVARIKEYLRSRRVLLCMDNFESVIPAAPVVDELFGSCPGVKVLVTSRVPLDLRWERRMIVDPLEVPDLRDDVPESALLQNPCVRLFIQRAQAANVRFVTTGATLRDIAAITVQLEGLPLAIELAAARTSVLSPAAIRQRLTVTGSMLQRHSPDTPLRHQSLQNALASSYEALQEHARTVFRYMGVFMGGVSLDTLEALLGESDVRNYLIESLSNLIDMSLVRFTPTPDGEAWYELLEPVRMYAVEQLQASGELDQVAEAHAHYYAALVERESEGLRWGGFFVFLPDNDSDDAVTPRITRWLEYLDRCLPDIRIALQWAQAHDQSTMLLQTAGLLASYWWLRGLLGEAEHWLELALAQSAQASPELASRALGMLGRTKRQQGKFDEAADLLDRAIALAHRANDTYLLTSQLIDRATVSATQRKISQGIESLHEPLEIARTNGDRWGVAVVEVNYGLGNLMYRRARQAENHLAESLASFRELRDLRGVSVASYALAYALGLQNKLEQALPYVRLALEAGQATRQRTLIPSLLEFIAGVLARSDSANTAARLLGAADELRIRGYARVTLERDVYEEALVILRGKMDVGTLTRAIDNGRRLSGKQAIEEALALVEGVLPPETPPAPEEPDEANLLTRRERQVLTLVVEGLQNREIGNRLGISDNTVKFHVTSILDKLGASSRVEAISIAIRRGLV